MHIHKHTRCTSNQSNTTLLRNEFVILRGMAVVFSGVYVVGEEDIYIYLILILGMNPTPFFFFFRTTP